jgi:hypothetical protein
MTYNFDPERWYENELSALKEDLESGRLNRAEYENRIKKIDCRYDEMVKRLDGTYRLPPSDTP